MGNDRILLNPAVLSQDVFSAMNWDGTILKKSLGFMFLTGYITLSTSDIQ
jgi:hypothetical protein